MGRAERAAELRGAGGDSPAAAERAERSRRAAAAAGGNTQAVGGRGARQEPSGYACTKQKGEGGASVLVPQSPPSTTQPSKN